MQAVESFVDIRQENSVAIISLNRSQAGNALNLDMASELASTIARVSNDQTVRCVMLTGTGRFFSVGGDIAGFSEAGPTAPTLLARITHHLHAAIAGLARMNKPFVTAINGPAAGAGLALAVVGDVAIAAHTAHFSMAYTAIGLTPDAGTSVILPRLVGLRPAQEMAFSNRRIASDEAVDIGLITRAVAGDQLMNEAMMVARKFADGPVAAFGATRRLLLSGFEQPFEKQLADEAVAIAVAAGGPEGQEGIEAFLNKRSPIFASKQTVETI